MKKGRPSKILIVDDDLDNIDFVANILSADYDVCFTDSGAEALDLIKRLPIDLILLDIVMPGIDGFEVCRRVKADPASRDIPIIFLTGLESVIEEEYGLSLGAGDFLHKPVSSPLVLARVRNHLLIANSMHELKRHNDELERRVAEGTKEIIRQNQYIISSQDATIMAFCALAETRDQETGNHIRRTQGYVRALAEKLRFHPRFQDFLTDTVIQLLFKSAPLHDVGKVAIPDAILLKPGKLNADEWTVMKTHCEAGWKAITSAAREFMDSENSLLGFAAEIAYGHHERWDGTGYPQGQSGDDIPLSARLMAVADVYDALTTKRPYKDAFTHQQAIAMMEAERELHFDPNIIDAMLSIQNDFIDIAQRYKDAAL